MSTGVPRTYGIGHAFSVFRRELNLVSSGSYDRYLRYILLGALVVLILSTIGLAEDYFHFIPEISIAAGTIHESHGSPSVLGYLSFLLILIFSPFPDYVILPVYGYFASMNAFNPYTLLVLSTVSMALYMQGLYSITRYGGRPLLMRVLKYMGISDKKLETSEKWIRRNGAISVFAFTFVPYLVIGMALASGMLAMNSLKYLIANIAGFAVRFAFLIELGFYGTHILASLVNGQAIPLYYVFLILSLIYISYSTAHFRRRETNV